MFEQCSSINQIFEVIDSILNNNVNYQLEILVTNKY